MSRSRSLRRRVDMGRRSAVRSRDVVGFALRWPGQTDGQLWISGDTVLYGGVLEVASRLKVDVALLHLGGVRFPITGPIRYSMTARDAIELCRLLRPRTAIPIHYEGWRHFQQDRGAIEREFARAPDDIRRRIRWLPIGQEVVLEPVGPSFLRRSRG